jgi:glyoxylase-like metal-dependent hydrolase (beta-lactamase superfamily II)
MAGDNQIPDGAPLSERLPRPPDLFLMTHLHWDHVSGLLDFSRPRAMIWDAEWDEYGGGKAMFGAELREGVDWVVVSNAGGGARQVLGQPAIDLYGDGKIWYLQLHGHTPGAAAVLVQGIDGPYLFVGDTAWVDRHLEDTRRPPLTRAVVDARKRQARQSLDWARWYQAHCPELKIITGHDPKWAPTSP